MGRHARMKCALIVAFVAHDIAELNRLPAIFNIIPGGVHDDCMSMELWIWHAIHRAGGPMDIFRPDEIAARAVGILTAFPHARLRGGFYLRHRFMEGLPEGGVIGTLKIPRLGV